MWDTRWVDHDPEIRREEYDLLVGDKQRVMRKLWSTVETSQDSPRRMRAIETMRIIMESKGSAEMRTSYLKKMIRYATTDSTSSDIEKELAEAIIAWSRSTGITQNDRAALIRKVQESFGDGRFCWMRALVEIRGRKETLLFIHIASQFADAGNKKDFYAIRNSSLSHVTWPGLLPHVKKWLVEPSVAPMVLEFSILSQTDAGRQVLLEYATNKSHPKASRQKSVEQLEETVAGLELLINASGDRMVNLNLSEVATGNLREIFAAKHLQLKQRLENEFLTRLINGLSPSYWVPTKNTNRNGDRGLDKMDQKFAAANLKCLQILTGRRDLTTLKQWKSWHLQTANKGISHDIILQLVLDHPDLIESPAIYNAIVILPWRHGRIPLGSLSLYKQMLHNKKLRYCSSYALLSNSYDEEAVPVAIELIENATPHGSGNSTPGEIFMLKNRFAVNFFWDAEKWRSWWTEHQKQESSSLAENPQ